MILIGDLHRMSGDKQTEVVNLVWKALKNVMPGKGPMPAAAILYLLRQKHNIQMDSKTIFDILGIYTKAGIMTVIKIENNEYHALAEETTIPTMFPPFDSGHTRAYYDLFYRYQAIREHPELATMSEEYIDSLYNPKTPDDGNHKVF